MLRKKIFDAVDDNLTFYDGKPILDFQVQFFTDECDDDLEDDEVDYAFSGFVSGYFRVYNERNGRLIKDLPMSNEGAALVLNTTDTFFEDLGNYYYEIGYLMSGGYELALMYGILKVI